MLKLVYSLFRYGLLRMSIFDKKFGYTLSEVLITLALIGFLATLTLSTVGSSIQQRTRLAEFRTAYSKMSTALKNVTVDTAKIYACFVKPTNAEVNEFGLTINGNASDTSTAGCDDLEHAFVRAMGATRFCLNNAISEGCVPANYPIADGCFEDYTKSRAYVFDNSMILITDKKANGMKLFAMDINGRKGPNKWGQDIFPFSIKYTETKTVQGRVFVKAVGILPPNETSCTYVNDDSGKTTSRMMKDSAGIITRD